MTHGEPPHGDNTGTRCNGSLTEGIGCLYKAPAPGCHGVPLRLIPGRQPRTASKDFHPARHLPASLPAAGGPGRAPAGQFENMSFTNRRPLPKVTGRGEAATRSPEHRRGWDERVPEPLPGAFGGLWNGFCKACPMQGGFAHVRTKHPSGMR
ncbi:hypothetical protein NY78_3584 [Desulfovibrio sp. TomC]|nr:hypothetical protein NY78_3584 [Desulfovibrio sp. TomC]